MAAATMVGPMGPCILGKDKLKRPKKWADWHRDAENKMRFSSITDSGRKLDFLRSCAGAELTELWDKEVRVVYEATGAGVALAEPASSEPIGYFHQSVFHQNCLSTHLTTPVFSTNGSKQSFQRSGNLPKAP